MRARQLSLLLLAALSIAGVHFENRVKASSAQNTSSINEIRLATAGGASGDFGCEYDGHVQLTTFGNVRSPGGEALPLNLGGDSRFQGMWKDAGTGLYYVRARYYDARTGRFLSRDPAEGDLEQPESFYPYGFANGNPHVFRDPTGLFTTADVIATVNAISAFVTVSLGSGGAQRFLTLLRTAAQPLANTAQQLGAGAARVGEVAKNLGLRVVRAIRPTSNAGLNPVVRHVSGLRTTAARLSFRGAPNSLIRGGKVARGPNAGSPRAFVTDAEGRIIREITHDRVKVRRAFTDPAGRVFESFRKAGPPTEEDLVLLRLLE